MPGRIVNFNKYQVGINDWLFFHPYEKPSSSDYYYLKLCREIKSILLSGAHKTYVDFLEDDEIKNLACFLVCYFEDVISQAGIWQAFTRGHQKLYGKPLPFYTVEEYYPEEINPEDIFFLLWYFISCTYFKEKLFYPLSGNIIQLGVAVYEVFEREYEEAPENTQVREFLTIPTDEDDFYNIRNKIDWLALHSYLSHFHGNDLGAEILEALENEDANEVYGDNMDMFVFEMRDVYINNKTGHLLAYKGKDWLASILGENHPLHSDLYNLTDKKSGFFLFQKEDKDFLYFQHLATDTVIPVTKKSLERDKNFKEGETTVLISFIKWKDEWWFSGTLSSFPYKADLVIDEKNSVQSRGLFNDKGKQEEVLKLQYDAFMKFNNGSPLAFLPGKDALNSCIHHFNKFYERRLRVSKADKREARKRWGKQGFTGSKEEKADMFDEFEDVPSMVFYNQKSGIEIIVGYNELIPDPANPSFDPGENPQHILNLLISEEFSTEFVKYIVDNYHPSGIEFPGEERGIMSDNLDFMLRFWKKDNYISIPQITLV